MENLPSAPFLYLKSALTPLGDCWHGAHMQSMERNPSVEYVVPEGLSAELRQLIDELSLQHEWEAYLASDELDEGGMLQNRIRQRVTTLRGYMQCIADLLDLEKERETEGFGWWSRAFRLLFRDALLQQKARTAHHVQGYMHRTFGALSIEQTRELDHHLGSVDGLQAELGRMEWGNRCEFISQRVRAALQYVIALRSTVLDLDEC